jgi:hypothetical protein
MMPPLYAEGLSIVMPSQQYGSGSEAGTTHNGHGAIPIKVMVQRVIALASLPYSITDRPQPRPRIRFVSFSREAEFWFTEENAPLYNFARILIAKPLSTAAETALLPFTNGKTTCSINQPHNPPPAPPARWPVFVLSNLPASDLVPSRA